jgi:hypothetical protein
MSQSSDSGRLHAHHAGDASKAAPAEDQGRAQQFSIPAGYADYYGLPVQRKAEVAAPTAGRGAAPSADGAGERIPRDVQTKMEGSFGVDLSGVRIHPQSDAASREAIAYTEGADIHFSPGEYAPHTSAGQELLGHELAHVVQQSQGRVAATSQNKGANDDDGLEREADDAGARAARGERADLGPIGTGSATAIQRKGWQKRMQDTMTHLATANPEKHARYQAALGRMSAAERKRIGKAIGSDGGGEQARLQQRITKLGTEIAASMESLVKDEAQAREHRPPMATEKNAYWTNVSKSLPNLGTDDFWVVDIHPTQHKDALDNANCMGWAFNTGADLWVDRNPSDPHSFEAIIPGGYQSTAWGAWTADHRETDIPVGSVVGTTKGVSINAYEHFIKRVPGGWESKLGPSSTIFHATLAQVGGDTYGAPSRVWIKQ